MKTTVSIVIPVYNVERYISRCLDSILAQTYENIEIICVDDCGTDHSMEIVRDYANRKLANIIIVNNPYNKGLGGARDAGIAAASGKYLMFVDSDDYVDHDYVDQYVAIAERCAADLVIGGFTREKRRKVRKTLLKDTEEDKWIFCSACCKLYKKDFLVQNKIDFRGIRRYEDEQFSLRVMMKNPVSEIIPYAGYHYIYNDQSITQEAKSDRTYIFEDYAKRILAFYNDVKPEHIENRELFDYCVLSRLTANLLYNARGCGIKRMSSLYITYSELLQRMFGHSINNKYITIWKRIYAEDFKVHYATLLVMRFRKIKLDKILFFLSSCL